MRNNQPPSQEHLYKEQIIFLCFLLILCLVFLFNKKTRTEALMVMIGGLGLMMLRIIGVCVWTGGARQGINSPETATITLPRLARVLGGMYRVHHNDGYHQNGVNVLEGATTVLLSRWDPDTNALSVSDVLWMHDSMLLSYNTTTQAWELRDAQTQTLKNPTDFCVDRLGDVYDQSLVSAIRHSDEGFIAHPQRKCDHDSHVIILRAQDVVPLDRVLNVMSTSLHSLSADPVQAPADAIASHQTVQWIDQVAEQVADIIDATAPDIPGPIEVVLRK